MPGREQSPRSRLFVRGAAIQRRTCFAWILLSRCDAAIPVAAEVRAPQLFGPSAVKRVMRDQDVR